jgi:hypothetical protein
LRFQIEINNVLRHAPDFSSWSESQMDLGGRARHSVRAVVWLASIVAHGVTGPTSHRRNYQLILTLDLFCGSKD